MKLRIMSDLHIDAAIFKFTHTEKIDEVLILAGDTANSFDRLASFLEYAAPLFSEVIVIVGNHEYYSKTPMTHAVKNLKTHIKCNGLNNVHILDKDVVTIGDVTFIGATLWADFRGGDPLIELSAKRGINDFRLIHKNLDELITPLDMRNRCREELEYIRKMCDVVDGKKVVITHFPPLTDFAHARWGSLSQNPLNGYFMSAFDHEIMDLEFDLWVAAHTHDSSNFVKYDKRFICNPRGYGKENGEFFNPNLVVEI